MFEFIENSKRQYDFKMRKAFSFDYTWIKGFAQLFR